MPEKEKPPKREKKPKEAKAWLKAKGHKAEDVDKKSWGTPDEYVKSIVELHGLSLGEFKRIVASAG